MSNTKNCPACNSPCERDEVDIGVGVMYGPWRCNECCWTDDPVEQKKAEIQAENKLDAWTGQ